MPPAILSENASEEEKRKALEAGGARWSVGKNRLDLIPPDALFSLGEVYSFGCTKYKEHNWAKGMKWGICFAAAMRHLWKWWFGEELDPESGLPHLAHAAWNVMSLLAYSLRRMTQFDDRYKVEDCSEIFERTRPQKGPGKNFVLTKQ